jgi:RNA polymerase sigma-70 factor (ECF subfamily)
VDQSGGTSLVVADEWLVRAALRGDERAFAQLVRRYVRKAMAVALEYVATREDAEDVVQDTFRRVYENLLRFDPSRPFEPWFFAILRNAARNAARFQRTRRHDSLTEEHATGQPSPFEDVRRLELRQRIVQALERLPAMQQTCFRLCLVEGLTSVEAAHAMGLAESTVRVHVFKARRTLQSLLDDWHDALEEA